MPKKITEDGKEVEVFTKEEVEAAAKEKADEAARAAEADKVESENKRIELEEKLADEKKKSDEKDVNLGMARRKIDQLEKGGKGGGGSEPVVDETTKKELEDLNKRLGLMETKPFEEMRETFVTNNKLAGDKDTKAKFDHFYGKLSAGAKTQADIQAALTGAFAAATGGSKKPNMDSTVIQTGADTGAEDNSEQAKNPDADAMFKRGFKISEETAKKYGGKKQVKLFNNK